MIAYRELRLLELDVLTALYGKEQQHFDISTLSLLDVDAFYWDRNKRVARPNRGSGTFSHSPFSHKPEFGLQIEERN